MGVTSQTVVQSAREIKINARADSFTCICRCFSEFDNFGSICDPSAIIPPAKQVKWAIVAVVLPLLNSPM